MISGILMVASFFITALARLDENLETVAKISPMNYYQGGMAIDGLKWGWVIGLLGISALFVLIAWWRFERRDIRVGGEGGWRLTGDSCGCARGRRWQRMVVGRNFPGVPQGG